MVDDERDDILDDEESEGSAVGESRGPSKIVKILLFVASGIFLIVVITAISYFVSKVMTERSYKKATEIVAAPVPAPLNTFELPEFAKPTADAEPHFFKMQISLGYEASAEFTTELIRRRDEMLHTINILLLGKKFEDLNSVTGAVELCEEIKAAINLRLTTGKVKEVYLKDFTLN